MGKIMFNIVEKNQKLVKGIMIFITITFVMWGIGSYLGMMGDDGYVAKVGGKKIYAQDIDNVMQQNKQFTDKMQITLALINRQLILNNANSYNFAASQEQIQNEIANIPMFQESGAFSLKKYQDFLRNNLISANQFQNNIQDQILINQTVDFFKSSYFTSNTFNDKFATILSQERNVSTYIIDPQKFYSQINLSEKQINDYYKQNIAKYTTPEQAKVQYIELNPATISNSIQVADSLVNSYIHDHESELANTQVDASHILLNVSTNADTKTKADIKAKAELILKEVNANPSKFKDLAKKYSQDTGSAKNGGDLGFFGHGAMVKPFENVAFSLKPNQISGIVETQFGFHILKLNARKENSKEQIRIAAIEKLKKQQSVTQIQQKLNKLNDLTYSKAKSLEPASKALGLSIQSTSDWISKNTSTGNFANPKVQKAIFNDDVLKNHNNSEVVDLGYNSYVVYRLLDYKPSQVQPLASVKDKITSELKQQQASQMAYKEAKSDVAKLKDGKLQLSFAGSQNVNTLSQNADISLMAVKQIFDTSIAKLPAYSSSINAKGQFVIYRINKETTNPSLITQNKKMLEQAKDNSAMIDLNTYLNALKNKFTVTYKSERLTQGDASQGNAS